MELTELKKILEALLLAASEPLSVARLLALLAEAGANTISQKDVAKALEAMADDCTPRGIELVEVASGFRYQVKQDVHAYVTRLWTERPSRYSRAMLETLALIAYRQPLTRGEIELVRGVSVSSNIIKTLEEREWIRVVGHRDAPGRPALFGTTRMFLDYFNLKSLDELPPLKDILALDDMPELALDPDAPAPAAHVDTAAATGAGRDGSDAAVAPSESGAEADTASTPSPSNVNPEPATADTASTTADAPAPVTDQPEENRA